MLHRQTPQGPEVFYLSQKVTTIGSDDCDLSFEDHSLEAQHAVVETAMDSNQGQTYFLKDLSDTSGTTINGHTWYSDCGPTELKPGDKITFGYGPEFTFYPLPPPKGPPRTTSRIAPQNRRLVSAVPRGTPGNGFPTLITNNRRESPRVRALVQLPPTHVIEAPKPSHAVPSYRQRFYRTSSLERGVNRRRMVVPNQWTGPLAAGPDWDQFNENARLENRIAELETMLTDRNRNDDTGIISLEDSVPETYGTALLESNHLRRELNESTKQQADLEVVVPNQWTGPLAAGPDWDQFNENARLENRIAELETMLTDRNRNDDTGIISLEDSVPETYGTALLESNHLRRELNESTKQQADLEARLAMAEKKLEARDEALTALAKGSSKTDYLSYENEREEYGLGSSFNDLDLSQESSSFLQEPSNRFDRLGITSNFLESSNRKKDDSVTAVEIMQQIRQAVVELICEDSDAIQKLSEDNPDVITLATRVMEYPWKSAENKVIDYEIKIREKLNKVFSDDVQETLDEQLKVCLDKELMPLFKSAETLDGTLKAWSDGKFKTMIAAIEGLQEWIGKFKGSVEEHGISGELLQHYKENLSSKEGPLKDCGDITAWLVPAISPLLTIAEEKVRAMEAILKEDAKKQEEASIAAAKSTEQISSLEEELREKEVETTRLKEQAEQEAEMAAEKQETLEQEISTLKELKARREDEILVIQLEKSNFIAETASLKQKLATMDPPPIDTQMRESETRISLRSWLVSNLSKAELHVQESKHNLETERRFINSDEYQSLSEEDQEALELKLSPLEDDGYGAERKRELFQTIIESIEAQDITGEEEEEEVKMDSSVGTVLEKLFQSMETVAAETHREKTAKEAGDMKIAETEKKLEILREALKKFQDTQAEFQNRSKVEVERISALEKAHEKTKQELSEKQDALNKLVEQLASLSEKKLNDKLEETPEEKLKLTEKIKELEKINELNEAKLIESQANLKILEAEVAENSTGEGNIAEDQKMMSILVEALREYSNDLNMQTYTSAKEATECNWDDTSSEQDKNDARIQDQIDTVASLFESVDNYQMMKGVKIFQPCLRNILTTLVMEIASLKAKTVEIEASNKKIEDLKSEIGKLESEKAAISDGNETPNAVQELREQIQKLVTEKLENEELTMMTDEQIEDSEKTIQSLRLELQVLTGSARDQPTDRSARERTDQELFDLQEKLVEMERRYNQVQEEILNLKNQNNELEAELKQKDETNRLINSRLVETVEKVEDLNTGRSIDFSTGNLAGKAAPSFEDDGSKSFWNLSNKLAGMMELDIKRNEAPELNSSLGGFRTLDKTDEEKDRLEAMEELSSGVKDLLDKVKKQNEELATYRSSEDSARDIDTNKENSSPKPMQQVQPTIGLPAFGSDASRSPFATLPPFSSSSLSAIMPPVTPPALTTPFGTPPNLFRSSPILGSFPMNPPNQPSPFAVPTSPISQMIRSYQPQPPFSLGSSPQNSVFGPVQNSGPFASSTAFGNFGSTAPNSESNTSTGGPGVFGSSTSASSFAPLNGGFSFGTQAAPPTFGILNANDDNSSNGSSTDSGVGSNSSGSAAPPSSLPKPLEPPTTKNPGSLLSANFFGTDNQLEVKPTSPGEIKSPTKSALRKPKESAIVERRSIPVKNVHFDLPDSQVVTEELIAKIQSEDIALQTEGVMAIRKILSLEHSPPIDDIIEAGFVPVLIEYLERDDNTQIQFEAAWALTNIASGSSAQTQKVTEAGALPHFARLLKSSDDNVQEQCQRCCSMKFLDEISLKEKSVRKDVKQRAWNCGDSIRFKNSVNQSTNASTTVKRVWTPSIVVFIYVALLQAVWALGNIAGDCPTMRDRVIIECQGGEEILAILNKWLDILEDNPSAVSIKSIMRNATWTLSNLCRGKPQPSFPKVVSFLPTLERLLHTGDDEILTDACWALSYISDGTNDRIKATIDAGVASPLVELLSNPSAKIITPALRTVGNLVTGDDHQTQHVIDCGLLESLVKLFSHTKSGIRKEAMWTASNIAAGTQDQIQGVIDAGIIPQTLKILSDDQFDVQKEAAWVICNITNGGTNDQIKHLVIHEGCLRPMGKFLEKADLDPRSSQLIIEGYSNILRVGETIGNENHGGQNPFTILMEESANVLETIENLQTSQNQEVYSSARSLLENYFDTDESESDLVKNVPKSSGTLRLRLFPPAKPVGAENIDNPEVREILSTFSFGRKRIPSWRDLSQGAAGNSTN